MQQNSGGGMQQSSMNTFNGVGNQGNTMQRGRMNNSGGMEQQSMNTFQGNGLGNDQSRGGRYSSTSMGSRSAYTSSGSSPQVQDASKGDRMSRIWEDYDTIRMVGRPTSIRDVDHRDGIADSR